MADDIREIGAELAAPRIDNVRLHQDRTGPRKSGVLDPTQLYILAIASHRITSPPPLARRPSSASPTAIRQTLLKPPALESLLAVPPPSCNAAAYAVAALPLASRHRPYPSSTPALTPPPPPRSVPPSYSTSPASPTTPQPESPDGKTSVLHPRVAVLLGVGRRWHLPLLFCRALSTAPAAWWGLRCALLFMAELLLEGGCGEGGEFGEAQWCVERRFRVTEVFLAVLWCCASAYLSFFFTDCLMSRWLLNYTPQATLVRLLTINSMNAYITSWVLYLSGGSEDPCLLLPAWICIATTLTFLYHMTHPRLAILKETSLSISVFSIASFISMAALLIQLHLSRDTIPSIPMFLIARQCWEWFKMGVGAIGRIKREL